MMSGSSNPLQLLKRSQRDFVVRVLWLKGLTIQDTARTVGATAGQVRGVVTRSLRTPRSEMSLGERQTALNRLREGQPDGLALPETLFRARPCESLSDFARKAIKAGQERRGKFEQVKDENGRPVDVIRTVSDGLEEARIKGWLYEAKTDGGASGIAALRSQAGSNLMRDFALAMVSPIKEAKFELGGTGGRPKNEIRDAAIDAAERLLGLENRVHQPCWPLLCAVCRDGFHIDDYARSIRKPARQIRRLFRRALDDIAVRYKLLDEREYRKRWGYRRRLKEIARERQEHFQKIRKRRMLKAIAMGSAP